MLRITASEDSDASNSTATSSDEAGTPQLEPLSSPRPTLDMSLCIGEGSQSFQLTPRVVEAADVSINHRSARLVLNVLRILQKLTKRSATASVLLSTTNPVQGLKRCMALDAVPPISFYALKLLKTQVAAKHTRDCVFCCSN